MNSISRLIAIGLAVVAVLLFTASVRAKGRFSKVVIDGPMLEEPLQVSDPSSLQFLGMQGLMLIDSIPEPALSDSGYSLVRYGDDRAFDRLRYYPNPTGGSGYVFYEGIVGGASEFDGKWFRANVCGESVLVQKIARGESRWTISSVAKDVPVSTPLLAVMAWGLGMLMGSGRWKRSREADDPQVGG